MTGGRRRCGFLGQPRTVSRRDSCAPQGRRQRIGFDAQRRQRPCGRAIRSLRALLLPRIQRSCPAQNGVLEPGPPGQAICRQAVLARPIQAHDSTHEPFSDQSAANRARGATSTAREAEAESCADASVTGLRLSEPPAVCDSRESEIILHPSDFGRIGGIIKWQDVRLIQSQRDGSENASQGGMIGKSRITEVLHPVKVVVQGVVYAVIAAKTHIY